MASMKISALFEFLEKPENEHEIKYLENLKYIENVKELPGFIGKIAKLTVGFASKHVDAIMALSECKNAEDLAAFKDSQHYKKLDNGKVTVIDLGINGDKIETLKDLEKLKEMETLKDR